MDWTLCMICQQDTGESLLCPLQFKGSKDKHESYKKFLHNAAEFRKLNRLPIDIRFDEHVTPEQLINYQAKWHKSCHLKFSSSKLEKAERKREIQDSTDGNVAGKRRNRQSCPMEQNVCLFCKKDSGHLHEFQTFQADDNIRRMATDLNEDDLLARIGGGDLIALEAKYHLACLTDLRNRHRAFLKQHQDSSNILREEQQIEARAFIELISHVQNSVDSGTFCFKVVELRQLYESRLLDLGIKKEVNKVRFKRKLGEYFPQAQEQSDGKNTVLMFEQGMYDMVKQAVKSDYEGDALILAKAAKIVRKDILNYGGFIFNGSFSEGCQQKSVPTSLKLLVNMILHGAYLKDHNLVDSQDCLTISQTIVFNCKKTSGSTDKPRHSSEHEPPLPLYVALNIHTQTRSKKLIEQLYKLGLSVSYKRILQLENQLAAAVCQQAREDGIVCPSGLRCGLFTIGALDNIDHNPSSTTATGSFHGTGVSMFQYPAESNAGTSRSKLIIPSEVTKESLTLPDSLTTVPAVAMKPVNVSVPEPPCSYRSINGHLKKAVEEEEVWMKNATKLIDKACVEEGDAISWSAYHASTIGESDVKPALTQLLPLFYEKAATAAMIKHGMNINLQATQFLNPNQIPVIALDAPLYALAKYVQWQWPQTHGEDKYIVMFGGLHIEMALWNTIGDYLEGSGWVSILTQAGIASTGTADSFLRSSHLTRTRHAHQVTALALGKLQEDAYKQLRQTEMPKDVWRKEMIAKSPTFQYWDSILEYEIFVLAFVRAHREADFSLYVESLKALVPWFFGLDHQNYARWIPVHIRDMESLPEPIMREFEENGRWVIPKTSNRFSCIPIDQAHEQNNETVKGSGGAVGLTENPSAFRKWMVAGPEQARLIKEFEEEYISKPTLEQQQLHHEEGLSTQRSFQQQATSLIETILEVGNPFLDDKPELVTLDSSDIMDASVVNTVRNIEQIGKVQSQDYITSVLLERKKSINEPIKKNSMKLFRSPSTKGRQKQKEKVSMLKSDVSLFSKMYIVVHHRGADMENFFRHENHPYPPSLSDRGKLYLGKKSDLLNCFEQDSSTEPPSLFDVKVLDGAAVVHFLPTVNVKTFNEYADKVFVSHIKKLLEDSTRVDVVWDTYLPRSIKGSTRDKRGKGTRRRVSAQTKIPGNWQDFLKDPLNKEELFGFLSERVASTDFPSDREVFITSGPRVVSRGTDQTMPTCNHEEADTRIIVHLKNALENGYTTCLVRTVDTDVVIILLGQFHHLLTLCPSANVWVAFGTGKSFTHYHINSIFHTLGEERSLALPMFHSYTGCDTVSAFYGKGKRLAWQAWKCFPEVTEAFTYIAQHPFAQPDLENDQFKLIEHFTVILYDKTSQLTTVNSARKDMFCHKSKAMDKIPPTRHVLLQHLKRAVYQASIWMTSHQSEPNQPGPEAWGWTLDRDSECWIPVWTTLPAASKACSELVKCNCKSASGCSGRCQCKKAGWRCTELCNCRCDK